MILIYIHDSFNQMTGKLNFGLRRVTTFIYLAIYNLIMYLRKYIPKYNKINKTININKNFKTKIKMKHLENYINKKNIFFINIRNEIYIYVIYI